MTKPTDQFLIDAVGVRHKPAGDQARILSLVPSITELLFDLGLAGQMVGRTAFCVHPQGTVERVPSVGGTKRVNMEKVAALTPSHVVVNIDETPKQVADALAAQGMTVVVTHPVTVTDNYSLFRLMGALFGQVDAAEKMCIELAREMDALAEAADGWSRRSVLYLIWQDPWMTISRDTYISHMLDLVGWQTEGHDPEVRYPEFSLNAETLATVDTVLFSTEPYRFTDEHVASFRQAFPEHGHKARLIDAEMTSWYGSRAIEGLRYLRQFAEMVSS